MRGKWPSAAIGSPEIGRRTPARRWSVDAPVNKRCGVLVIGDERLRPDTIAAAEACDEVFIVARAAPNGPRWFVDETRAYNDARARLERLRRHLRAHGVVVHGIVVDATAAAARKDAEALCPQGTLLT
jgi:hypothetical protein